MLGFLFGFNARIGRLHYFLGTIALAVVMTAVIFAITSHALQNTPEGMHSSLDVMTWPVIIAGVVFAWITFSLQSMRIRDIGWDPVCVIPGWIALLMVDKLVAGKIPAWALGHEHHGTIVGSLVNLALFLALAFWPSGDYENPTPTLETPRKPGNPPPVRNPASAAADRLARVAGGEFGRRSV
jgi:uncharacterized membrane protein YhaH (DUF805 family)